MGNVAAGFTVKVAVFAILDFHSPGVTENRSCSFSLHPSIASIPDTPAKACAYPESAFFNISPKSKKLYIKRKCRQNSYISGDWEGSVG
jgi:hypothetical protein